MALDPRIPLGILTPGDINQQVQTSQLNDQNIQMNQNKLDAQKAAQGQPDYDAISKQMDVGMKLLSTVKDQASYDRAKQMAAQYGIKDLELLPAQYDPQIVDQLGRATMTYKEQLDAKRADAAQSLTAEKTGLDMEKTKQEIAQAPQKFALDQQKTAADIANSGGALEARQREQAFQERKFGAEQADAAAKKADPTLGLKPMPATALKMQREELDAIGTASTINADMGKLVSSIDDGTLQLGPVENMGNQFKNWRGASDDTSRAYATFKSTLEKMRNDSLRLNKGVQTEGDAQRAWNEILANTNDVKLVKARLQDVQAINERAAALRKMNVDNIRSNYGYPSLDTSGYENQPAAVMTGGKPPAAPAAPGAPASPAQPDYKSKYGLE